MKDENLSELEIVQGSEIGRKVFRAVSLKLNFI